MSAIYAETTPLLKDHHPFARDVSNEEEEEATDRENDQLLDTWGMKDNRAKPRRVMDTVGLGCVTVGLLLFLPIVQYIVLNENAKTKGGLGWFVWHPTMQSLAITIVVLSIQSLQSTTSPAGSLQKKRAFNQHRALLLALAFPMLIVGSFAMWYNKKSHGAPHFTTWHGKFGLVVLVWMIVQALIGGFAHYFSSSMGIKATRYYKYHRLSGYILLPLILVVAHLGGSWSDWMVGHSSLTLRIAAFDVGLALVAMGVVMRIRPSKMKLF